MHSLNPPRVEIRNLCSCLGFISRPPGEGRGRTGRKERDSLGDVHARVWRRHRVASGPPIRSVSNLPCLEQAFCDCRGHLERVCAVASLHDSIADDLLSVCLACVFGLCREVMGKGNVRGRGNGVRLPLGVDHACPLTGYSRVRGVGQTGASNDHHRCTRIHSGI